MQRQPKFWFKLGIIFFTLGISLGYLVLLHPLPFSWELSSYQFLASLPFLSTGWLLISAAYPLVFLLILFLLLGFWEKNKKDEILLIIFLTTGVVLAKVFKKIVHRPCPPLSISRAHLTASSWLNQKLHHPLLHLKTPQDYCWPSGHTLTYTLLFGGIILLFYSYTLPQNRWSKIINWLSIFLVGTIGLSRLALGQHWLLDVIGGYLIGLGWLFLVMSWFFSQKKNEN